MRDLKYRLGLDVGTNSLGWCVLQLDASDEPSALADLGVRIFTDGREAKTGTPLAVGRRTARAMRRRRDRFLRRQRDLMNTLVKYGLMPDDVNARKALERLDPYALRARGLDQRLELHELGRALFHLHQRRGFKSNRKTDRGRNESDSGLIAAAAERVQKLLLESGARTFGELLARRHAQRQSVRARLHGTGKDAFYDVYPTRDLVAAEFERLWQAQAQFHPSLTDEAREAVKSVFFRQRPLKPVPAGKCALDPARDGKDVDGFRAPWALPSAQEFRIRQTVNDLRIGEVGEEKRPLSASEREIVTSELLRHPKRTFDQLRRKLKLPTDCLFSHESERRKYLIGDETAAVLAKPALFGTDWYALDHALKTEIVAKLIEEEDEEELIGWLCARTDITPDVAVAVARTRLPEGYCRLGRRALSRLLPFMREGLQYHEAAARAGYHHSDHRQSGGLWQLPYYGEWLDHAVVGTGDLQDPPEVRFGRLANPTVHIGLNQLRRVVNAIMGHYGPPSEIVVELARDLKLSREQKDRLKREQAENQRQNEIRAAKLKEQGLDDSPRNRLMLRLWEELNPRDASDRRCPFTGEQISIARLFNGEVEIEHILPFSRTWDDSGANKTVSLRFANRAKTNRSPFEAFAANPTVDGFTYDWESILERARAFPGNKRWRFEPDAMARFDAQGGWLARQLNDTRYLARLTKDYLSACCDPDRIWVVTGQLTALLRGKWGLNALPALGNYAGGDVSVTEAARKNRNDHRHHAIDAFVAGVTSRSMLQRVAAADEVERERFIGTMPEPFPEYRDTLNRKLDELLVSYKLDHGPQGQLHEETAYGLVREPAAEDGCNVVYRKPLASLNANEIERVRDRRLRDELRATAQRAAAEGVVLAKALQSFAEVNGLRRVRLLKRENEAGLVPIHDRHNGRSYKAYAAGEIHRVEIFATPDGRWHGEGVSLFNANQRGYRPRWHQAHQGARLVMRLHKGDLVELEVDGIRRVMRVARLEPSLDRLRLHPLTAGGELQKRHADTDDPFRWKIISYEPMRRVGARRVHVDERGQLNPRSGAR